MAHRSNGCGLQAAEDSTEVLTVAALPDELLICALGFLDLRDRQRAALVCRRFAAAACSPVLLREIKLPVIRNTNAMNSMAAWLARHSRHVRALMFYAELPHAGSATALAAAVATCLTAAGAAGQLQELAVYSYPEVHTGWLCTTHTLRQLSLSGVSLFISPAIAGLTGLQSLELCGYLQFEAGARLPASITRLAVERDNLQEELPPELTQLPRLQRLELARGGYSPDSLSRLSGLAGSLTRLEIEFMEGPSDGLSALLRLQHLWFEVDNAAAVEALAAALPHLTHLTCLFVHGPSVAPLLPALSALSQLQLCHLAQQQPEGPASWLLPGGPWLGSLRWLSVGIGPLLTSAPTLQAAGRLECISVVSSAVRKVNWRSPAGAAFFDFAARHPPLRRLSIIAHSRSSPFKSKTFATELRQLCQRRPALLVEFPGFVEQGEPLWEFLERTQPF